MQNKIPKASEIFLVLAFVFAIIGSSVLFLSSKGDVFLTLNKYGTYHLDEFFKLYTHLGLGVILAILSILFLFIRYYYSILFATTLVCAGIFTFVLKRMLFPGMPRPGKVFDINTLPHVVNNIHLNQVGSFPSGHTMTAFAGAFAITIVLKEKYWGLVAFIMAFFVGISRIYLCQHFFMDIYAGALIT